MAVIKYFRGDGPFRATLRPATKAPAWIVRGGKRTGLAKDPGRRVGAAQNFGKIPAFLEFARADESETGHASLLP